MYGNGGRPSPRVEKGFSRHPLYKNGVFTNRNQAQVGGMGASRHGRLNAVSGLGNLGFGAEPRYEGGYDAAYNDLGRTGSGDGSTISDESAAHALLSVDGGVKENDALLAGDSSPHAIHDRRVCGGLRRTFTRCFTNCFFPTSPGERAVYFRSPAVLAMTKGGLGSSMLGNFTSSENDYDYSASSGNSIATREAISTVPKGPYPPNIVRNQKYSIITFLPLFLYNEFRFFFNLYFLMVALSQLISVLRVGFLFTYVAPLVLVLMVSMAKEIYDDLLRFRRDRVANNELFNVLQPDGMLLCRCDVIMMRIYTGCMCMHM